MPESRADGDTESQDDPSWQVSHYGKVASVYPGRKNLWNRFTSMEWTRLPENIILGLGGIVTARYANYLTMQNLQTIRLCLIFTPKRG